MNYLFNVYAFEDLQGGMIEAESISEMFEQESRRYSRQLEEETEARLR